MLKRILVSLFWGEYAPPMHQNLHEPPACRFHDERADGPEKEVYEEWIISMRFAIRFDHGPNPLTEEEGRAGSCLGETEDYSPAGLLFHTKKKPDTGRVFITPYLGLELHFEADDF